MRKITLLLMTFAVILPTSVLAVPTLQVGVPDGSGGYVDYTTSGSDEDTAFTTGQTLHVAGVWGPNTSQLGGQYSGGKNWSDFDFPSVFDDYNAILLVSVPESSNDGLTYYTDLKISVDGSSPINVFYFSDSPSYFPNQHYPIHDDISDFLYFDIGNFSCNETVPDFETETGSARGEIKEIRFQLGTLQLDWIHFDVMALQTNTQGQSRIVTSLENNPGSHDVTWTNGGSPPQAIPEPATMLLLGSGLVTTGILSRKRNTRRHKGF